MAYVVFNQVSNCLFNIKSFEMPSMFVQHLSIEKVLFHMLALKYISLMYFTMIHQRGNVVQFSKDGGFFHK